MLKILVIEDEFALRQEIIEWLTYEDYEAIGAANGVEGVILAGVESPDLIICDISMPLLDGYGVLLELQANPALQSTPFIFLSAKADKDDVRKGIALGADDYITKPFDRADLLEAIRTRFKKQAKLDIEHQEQTKTFKEALAAERHQRLLQTKLVAMFTHDFGSQLTVILSAVSLLRDYADRLTPERRMERLNDIENSARLLIAMRDDMLIMAQMDVGRVMLKRGTLDVTQFFSHLVQEFQEIQGENHQLEFKSDVHETVVTDERFLRHIASNLISNALKYSPPESTVQVALEKHDTYFGLVVKDHGIGIPEADLSRLSTTFHRGSNVDKIEGTGLGLAVVKQASALLGGSFNVESQVGVGTTMTVSLPYAVPGI